VQAASDIEQACKDLTVEEVWMKPHGVPSFAFHLRHIAGSVDRLLTYAKGEKLSSEQFAELAAETEFDEAIDAPSLVQTTLERIEQAVEFLRLVDLESLFEKRFVGRMELPTNVFGLLFHIAEHTQRHVGQAITTAKIVRNQLSAGLSD
ncbi:DinB family protein, partial [Escherichia coli]|uniref:DinB family protein n=1 Tax=Escherichia coli TaxID=562 RepID=UPI002157A81A